MEMRHIDQSDIVNALNVSASTVSDWVRGKKYPRVDAMQALANYLGVLISDLTTENDDSTGREQMEVTEVELLAIYRSLNDIGQAALMGTARGLAANPDMKRGSASNTETA
jgi:transcriptional regulator with XRE-family HTH domain